MVELLVFKSATCGPCKMITPILNEMEANGQVIRTVMTDDEEGRNEAAMYGVRGVPTIFVMKNGDVVDKLVGYRPKKDLLEAIERLSK
jgi:thioredoxin 1